MKNFSTEFKKHADRITLTDAERSHIIMRVTGRTPAPIASMYAPVFSYFSYSRSFAVAFSLLLIVSTGGTLSAAEGAVPGDFLYTIKRSVNEPLSGALAISAESESAWHERVATARLTEAEALSKKGKLTEEVSAELAADFAEHAEKVAVAAPADASLSMESDTALLLDEARTDREEAKQKFRAFIAAKGASILEASAPEENEGRIASANFVLSVLPEEESEAQEGESVALQARMGKQSLPAPDVSATLMAFGAPAGISPEDQEQDLAELAKDAKKEFQKAGEAIGAEGSAEARASLARLLPILVRAEAEMVTGLTDRARQHFDSVIERAKALRAAYTPSASEDATSDALPPAEPLPDFSDDDSN